jgi:hypothetical protein
VFAGRYVSVLLGPGEDSIESSILGCNISGAASEAVQLAEERVLVDTSGLAGNLALVDELEIQSKRPRVDQGKVEGLLLGVLE